jgi:hypothetical protein
MRAGVRRRGVAHGRGHRPHLTADGNAGADPVAVALRADQPDDQPAPVAPALVLPQLRRRSQRQNDDIEAPVAVEVRDAAAAVHRDGLPET